MTFEGYVIFVRYFGNGDKVSILVLVRKLGWWLSTLTFTKAFNLLSNSPFRVAWHNIHCM